MEFMCLCGVRHGHNSAASWDGLPVVVFFGDDVQLPPLLDSPVYNPSGKCPASMHGVLRVAKIQLCCTFTTNS